MKRKSILRLASIAAFLLSVLPTQLAAQGILFSEYRILLQNQSIASLQVCNPTDETLSFSLSFVNKQMDENGMMSDIPDTVTSEWALKNHLRIYPRNVTLDPGKCQEIQIQLKAPPTLADGEYRSYLHFLPLQSEAPADSLDAGGVQMAIVFRVGAAIPIIYRKNTTVTEVQIDSVSLTQQEAGDGLLHFIIRRDGTQSVYGRILVESTAEGLPVVVADAPANAVFTEIDFKRIAMPVSVSRLDRDAEGHIKLKISYIDAEKRGAPKPIVWATTLVDVGI